MATYNFITLDNGGVSVLVDGKYQNTFFEVVAANYVNGNLNVSDSLGYKFSFNIDNSFEISGVAVVGNATVKCEAIVAILPTSLSGTLSEVDPVFSASTAHSITPTNVSNWNTAFGWGNHASAGYLTSSAAASTYQPIGSYLTSITSGNVTTALGFTPYNSSNPSGYLTSSAAASTYQPIGSYLTSITSGNVTSALGFTPYNSSNPSGYISSYTETDPVFVANGLYKNGVSGGQTFKGGTGSSENATISSTNHSTKGNIILGNSYYNEAKNNFGIQTSTPAANLHVAQSTTGPGTVSNSAGGTTVTGTGTAFTNTFKVNDSITIGGQTVVISSIASDTSMSTAAITAANTNATYTLTGGSRFTVAGNGKITIDSDNRFTMFETLAQGWGSIVHLARLTIDAGSSFGEGLYLNTTNNNPSFFGTGLVSFGGTAKIPTIAGSTASGGNGVIQSSTNAVKGAITIGTVLKVDEANRRFELLEAVNIPSSNLSGGGYLYVEGGALKYRGSSGTITTLGNA